MHAKPMRACLSISCPPQRARYCTRIARNDQVFGSITEWISSIPLGVALPHEVVMDLVLAIRMSHPIVGRGGSRPRSHAEASRESDLTVKLLTSSPCEFVATSKSRAPSSSSIVCASTFALEEGLDLCATIRSSARLRQRLSIVRERQQHAPDCEYSTRLRPGRLLRGGFLGEGRERRAVHWKSSPSIWTRRHPTRLCQPDHMKLDVEIGLATRSSKSRS